MSAHDIAVVIGAVTALVVAVGQFSLTFHMHGVVSSTRDTVAKVDAATNGTLTELLALVQSLRETQATAAEMAARKLTEGK